MPPRVHAANDAANDADDANEDERDNLLRPARVDPQAEFERLTRGFAADLTPALNEAAELRRKAEMHRTIEGALEEMGTGRFQYLLLTLTAFGHFVEAAESTLLGVLFPVLMADFAIPSEKDLAIVGALTAVGCMLGAGTFAQASNVFGRRASYQVSLALCVAFGLASSFATSLGAFAALRMCFGVGYGGNMVASTTLLVELTPSHSRGSFMTLCGVAYGLGAIFSTLVAWAVVPTLGWRWLIRIVSIVSLPTVLALPCIPESPRFYAMRHRIREAIDSLQSVARANRVELPRHVKRDLEQEASRLPGPGDLPSPNEPALAKIPWASLARSAPSLVPLALVWFSHSFAATIFWFIPLEIQKRTPADTNVKFQVALTMACGGLLGCFVILVTARYFGRIAQLRWSLLATAGLTMVLGLDAASPTYVFVVAFVLEVVSQIPISMLYTYTPEAHPTDVRTLAFGLCQFAHRLAPIISPFAATALNDESFESSCLVFGAIFGFSFLLTFALRRETFGRGLVEDDDFAEDVQSVPAAFEHLLKGDPELSLDSVGVGKHPEAEAAQAGASSPTALLGRFKGL